jgi:Calcineurin-like phosphoesterase
MKCPRYVGLSIVALALFGLSSVGLAEPSGPERSGGRARPAKFEFALIGDVPYTPVHEAQYENMIAEINREHVAFTVHDGDIKSGSTLCDDLVYANELARFERFRRPVIYTPGDNEWTDCHRANNGGYDPLTRLALLRSVLFADPATSYGERELELSHQGPKYPENARWTHGRVTFATVHVVGSNNNRGRNPENDVEYAARNAANLDWLNQTFEQAAAQGSVAVVIVIQANPFEANTVIPSGFDEFLGVLRVRTLAFDGNVMLVHGDTHTFRIDKPLLTATGARIENFTRVETFGNPDAHWIRVGVDANNPEVFTFEMEIVAQNVVT